jgi:hypothetical protein
MPFLCSRVCQATDSARDATTRNNSCGMRGDWGDGDGWMMGGGGGLHGDAVHRYCGVDYSFDTSGETEKPKKGKIRLKKLSQGDCVTAVSAVCRVWRFHEFFNKFLVSL